jgi:thiamine transporter ThiT
LVEALSPGALGFVYSLVYNGMYMVPEIILTAVVAVLLARARGIVTKVS